MRVISKRTLREFWQSHSNAQPGLLLWYQRLFIAFELRGQGTVFSPDQSVKVFSSL
jgi:hypothetical protein